METPSGATAELYRQMLATYGRETNPEQVAMYVEVVGAVPLEVLREALLDAMRSSGDFPPGPGTVAQCVAAIRRVRQGALLPARTADPVSPAERVVFREYQRRLQSIQRRLGPTPIREWLEERERVASELASDLKRLSGER